MRRLTVTRPWTRLDVRPRLRAIAVAVRDGGPLAPLALALVVLPAVGAAMLIATAPVWLPALREATPSPWPWFTVLSMVFCALSLIPTHAASLVAGMLFGALGGSASALLAVVGAAALGFVALRPVASSSFERFLRGRPRARAVHEALVARPGWQAVGLIALVRLSPLMPFAGTNLLFASASVGLRAFLLGSALGLAPRVIAVALLGVGLDDFDPSRGPGWGLAVVGVASAVAFLWIVGRIARQRLRALGLDAR